MSPYRHSLQFKEAAGFADQTEFVCPAMAKEKDKAVKLEAITKEAANEMQKASKSYTELIVERF
jgi:hypothetical protein